MSEHLIIADNVKHAIAENRPVVALESTIITHGMPYPQNVQLAAKMERLLEGKGVQPATIAIMDGAVRVGLSESELSLLGQGEQAAKVSLRDLPSVLGKKCTGGTTVAATMFAAEKAGIAVFATGGIGGVHRGAEDSFDISADLEALKRFNVAVVCAGPKAILDLPKTMELLETYGVPVIGYRTDRLPAFYTAKTSIPVPVVAESAREIADQMAIKKSLGLAGGALIVNPIPEEFSLDGDVMEREILAALAKAKAAGISGKDITPFLLHEICESTGGNSLEANCRLVENNVALAGDIAASLQ